MLFAQVVFSLAVEGPFDYIVPKAYESKIKIGSRVWVNLRNKRQLGYCVGLSESSKIKHLKAIETLVDASPIIDSNMLDLTKKLSQYYCCSWGEMIETALPKDARKGKAISFDKQEKSIDNSKTTEVFLLQDVKVIKRWEFYVEEIKKTYSLDQSVIVLFADVSSLIAFKTYLLDKISEPIVLLFRSSKDEFKEFQRIRNEKIRIILGTRSAVFAPCANLGLIIIDNEESFVYKQDQVPHYHARMAAFFRVNLEKAKLILGCALPTLETYALIQKGEVKLIKPIELNKDAEVKVVDTRELNWEAKKGSLIELQYLVDSINQILSAKGKVLVFMNRKGFSTTVFCHNCKKILKCPKCNINLIFHHKQNLLKCHYCSFKMVPPQICPTCNSGYIKYSGFGTEKVESELSRIFPEAVIARLDEKYSFDSNEADIFISTESVLKFPNASFDLTVVLSIDNSLNQVDFRASEKTFHTLSSIFGLTKQKMIVCTNHPDHYSIHSLKEKNPDIFFSNELKERKQLLFPPYRHFASVKCRGRIFEKVEKTSHEIFNLFKLRSKRNSVKILSCAVGRHQKLRGNFYMEVLLSATDPIKLSLFIKSSLKGFKSSSTIITVDIDPV